ncbi:MAG: UDP-N-acetylmuramate--L-alanine ligase [Oscillospiraceae bacterium]|nr:UDP-N-acetylmuramate--L-alanine ligase [Oscillospiraceae bacterium]
MKAKREEDSVIHGVKRIHMIGIGGSGMCPLAEILHNKGYILTGSDNNESDNLKRVRKLGIKVFMGHDAKNIAGAQLVVYSAAISAENPELVAARETGTPIMERSHLLGALTRQFEKVIGVCGTHGKTTVTSMLTQILYMAEFDPTAVIGGKLPLIDANGRVGNSEYMVCEACEFVDTFLQMSPDMSVLLNIDNDHLDYFGTMDNLVNSFKKFITMSSISVVNGDDELAKKAISDFGGEIITFGITGENDYTATNISQAKFGMEFDVVKNGEVLTRLKMQIPGRHNIYNGLAAFAASDRCGVPIEDIKKGIESFGGAGRRFEKLGEFGGITLVDDYAHHPTELKATLTAAKQLGFSRIIAIFQPFTFSRTELLKNDFIKALAIADKVILMPIMGSRENNLSGISSQVLAKGLKDCVCVETFEDVANTVQSIGKGGDVVITMGGGDIYKAAYIIRDRMS